MFKTIALLKRRQGLTMQEFIDYYETRHRLIGEKYLRGAVTRYVRRFLHPMPNPVTGKEVEADYDVVMEMWFPDRDTFKKTMAKLATPEIAAEILEDEERVFDRAKSRLFVVEEHESDIA